MTLLFVKKGDEKSDYLLFMWACIGKRFFELDIALFLVFNSFFLFLVKNVFNQNEILWQNTTINPAHHLCLAVNYHLYFNYIFITVINIILTYTRAHETNKKQLYIPFFCVYLFIISIFFMAVVLLLLFCPFFLMNIT